MTAAPAAILDTLAARSETLAVAESLTGGLLAATLVDVPGASRVFRGGVLVYATDLKASLAGVPEELLAEHGPVHPEVAAALAEGVRVRCQATWGVATTGVAGPDPQDGIPPGIAYVSVAGPAASFGSAAVTAASFVSATGPAAASSGGPSSVTRRLDLSGDRAAIRAGAVAAALDLLAVTLGLTG
jgi:nicotinamide-nucleotide amidase